jgi:parallel beta-helix repeat protein
MYRKLLFVLLIGWNVIMFAHIRPSVSSEQAEVVKGKIYYVRQTVGNDENDGLSPKTAWQHVGKLSSAMHAGDTAYIGPGLYRDGIDVQNNGTAEQWLKFIADTTGKYTGDPPGIVMITGAEPVDESIFTPYSALGVYMAPFSAYTVWGVVEMDGDQYRYNRVTQTKEYLVDKMPAVDVVAKFPSSYFYDENAKVLYIHTSDGKPPNTHEIEFMRCGSGISMTGKHYVTVIGFTFRHMQDAGINFFKGSSDGIAIGNTSYGSRQGIRVYTATRIIVEGNTLFRNENCGVYFAAQSVNGLAIDNIAYENIKGVRWSSQSVGGIAIDNTLFDNHERGISIEETNDIAVRRNRVVNNTVSQLLMLQSKYDSEDNCFANGNPEQLTADFSPFPFTGRYKTLAEYQQGQQQDLHSREGDCGPLPKKIAVHKLHEETMAYTERARKILSQAVVSSSEGTESPEGEGAEGIQR